MRRTKLAIALLVSTVAVGAANAQQSYPCADPKDLSNPYHLVTGWAQTPRPWGPNNAMTVDANNNLWVVDRCPDDACVPVFELSPQGRTLKNFGAGLFIEPHSATVDRICEHLGVVQKVRSGSVGLKFGLIAEGRAHLYLHVTSQTNQWDTCGPEAILRAAGGTITDLRGELLQYNRTEIRNLNGIVASNGTRHAEILQAAAASRR